MKTLVRAVVITVAVSVAVVSNANAQGTTGSTQGRFEVSLFGGGTFDLPGASAAAGQIVQFPPSLGSGTYLAPTKYETGRKVQPLWGGGVAFSLTSWLWLTGDWAAAVPGEYHTVKSSVAGIDDILTADRHYWTGDFAFQFTYKTVHTVMPYVEAGVGLVHDSYSLTRNGACLVYTGTPPSGSCATYGEPIPGTTDAGTREARTLYGPYFGGGVRIYRGERWGVRISADGGIANRGIPYAVASPDLAAAGLNFVTAHRRGWGEFRVGIFRQFGGH